MGEGPLMQASPIHPTEPLANHRIIVIDDNVSIHDDYRKILVPPMPSGGLDDLESALFGASAPPPVARPRFALTSATQGQEGYQQVVAALAADNPFAMAFVDMRMPPGWDGMETTMRILADDPDIQIVICTAYSDYSWEDMARMLGATDRVLILKKPFDNVEVTQLAMALCRKWSLARMARNRMQILETLVQERVRELAASNARLSTLIKVSPVGIFALDRDGKVASWNPAAERIFGWSSDEVVGGPLPGDLAHHLRELTLPGGTMPAPGVPGSADLRVLRKDGAGIEVATYSAALGLSTGDPEGHIVVAADITARKQIESELRRAKSAAEAAASAKSEFLASMSHEIRTPMNGVLGMAELLLTTRLDGEQRDFAQTIQNSGEALLAIINDILDFSKIEAGMVTLDPIPFDLPIAVAGVVDLLAARAEAKGVQMIMRVAPDLISSVIGDAGRIRQVITNLIGNAVKFTMQGHVFVDVSRQGGDPQQQQVRIAISDTGIGIPADKLGHLFQKFTQADSSTTRRFGGTGLGLAISKQLVELMDGTITVASEAGRGSTFTIDLPLVCGPQSTVPRAPLLGEIAGVQVLIADSNPVVQRVLEEQVRSCGCQPVVVSFASEVLRTLRAHAATPGVRCAAILDAHLPDGDVLDLGRAIRAMPELAGIPLLLLTSLGQRGDSRRAVESGFNAYLTKPVHPTDLRDALTTLLTPSDRFGDQLVTRHSLAEARGNSSSGPRRCIALQTGTVRGDGPRVLVVEDNAANSMVICRILEHLGCRIIATASGSEAVELSLTGGFALVLMDYHLPGMDGVSAVRAIRARERGTRVPIIAMSASVLDQDRALFTECGMDGLVNKPIRIEDIQAVIARYTTGETPATETPTEPKQ